MQSIDGNPTCSYQQFIQVSISDNVIINPDWTCNVSYLNTNYLFTNTCWFSSPIQICQFNILLNFNSDLSLATGIEQLVCSPQHCDPSDACEFFTR